MNTLSEDIQNTIYKYKHEIEFRQIVNELKSCFGFCGWCGKHMPVSFKCNDCWDDSESEVTLYKIHCSRCGDGVFMEFIPDYLPMCNDCDRDLERTGDDYDFVFEQMRVPKKHHRSASDAL